MHLSFTRVSSRAFRETAQELRFHYQRLTWRYRALPNFIIVGAQKAGTTSLYHYLTQHPQLLPSYEKEVHFFDDDSLSQGDRFRAYMAHYRANFPLKHKARKDAQAFEASPMYLFHPLAPKRIFEAMPRVKLIVLLRNPTERAISHYFHESRLQRETLPIFEALQQEEARLEEVLQRQNYQDKHFRNFSYKSRGLYRQQLERYFQYFDPNQILILNSQELFKDTEDTLRQIFEFVGVDTSVKVRDYTPKNVSHNRTTVDAKVYQYLNAYFHPHNQALYGLLGKNFGW